MDEFFSFRRMITPAIIQIVFIVGLVICGIAALVALLGAHNLLAFLAFVIVGPLVLRIYCELLILFFVMNDAMQDIRQGLAAQPKAPAAPSFSAATPGSSPLGRVATGGFRMQPPTDAQ